MGSYSLKILFLVFVCLAHTNVSIFGFNSPSQNSYVKCIEREREALLNFKQSVRDYCDMLFTWRDDENNRDCCKWEGIKCNNETGHVEMLDLRGSESHYLSGSINITALVDLQKLQHLDLSFHHHFSGGQIPASIGSFQSLRYLNLSCSRFPGPIPYELENLSKLEYLDLKTASINGEIPYQLEKLSSLRYLDLSNNDDFYGEVPFQLGNLTHLWYLDLSHNSLYGAIPSQLRRMSQLRYLDLSGNLLSGALPFQVGNLPLLHYLRLDGNYGLKLKDENWLSSLSSLTTLGLHSFPDLGLSPYWLQMIRERIPNLRELSLVDCGLSDYHFSSLFPSHSNISTSLSILHLSDNMLTSSTFQLLSNYSPNLQELHVSNNCIDLSSAHFPNFPSLVILDLSKNNLNLISSRFQGNLNFSTKLQELHLENCNLTDRSFLVPTASNKYFSFSLVTLSLSQNLLQSSVVFHWIFNFTTNLQSLSLDKNMIEGPIPDVFGKVMNSLEVLKLETNKLKGEIPASLGSICTLKNLYLSHNNLSGEISSFIQNSSWCNRHVFEILDLSYNRMIGMLPNLSIFTSLRKLDLSYNLLNGEIPKSIGLLYRLQSLHLEENYLEGDINELHLTNLSQLMALDLTDNSLSLKFATNWIPPFQLFTLALASCKLGPNFPSWLQAQNQLIFLDISNARIDDFVPDWFWIKLQSMNDVNMSYNSIKGSIPNIPIKENGLENVILNSNQLEGAIPSFLSQAQTLDLSENKISDLNTFVCANRATKNMHTFDVSNNQIVGQLSDCWEHLSLLKFLDLRNNKLSGKISQSIGTLVNLQVLVLRNNNFIRELPLTLKNCSGLGVLDVSKNLLSGPVPSWIGESLQRLKMLKILSLRGNHLFGNFPIHLCYLSQIQVLDLSRNKIVRRNSNMFDEFFNNDKKKRTPKGHFIRERKVSTQGSYPDIYDSCYCRGRVKIMSFGIQRIFFKSIDLSTNGLTREVPKEVRYLLGLVSFEKTLTLCFL